MSKSLSPRSWESMKIQEVSISADDHKRKSQHATFEVKQPRVHCRRHRGQCQGKIVFKSSIFESLLKPIQSK